MKDLIKYIVRALVDHPEQIEISEITSKQVTILELKVAKEDMGKESTTGAEPLRQSGQY